MAEKAMKRPQSPPDDGIPAGDSAPKSRWPLVLAAAAWGTWLAFMIVMMVARLHEVPRGK